MGKIKNFFKDRNKRYFILLLLFLPILIASGVMVKNVYREYKNIKSFVTDEVVVTNDHKIDEMNYVLRDTDTDYQLEIFTELKNAIANPERDDKDVAGMIVKNFVADYFTWSNKVAQYDVGGMYFIPKYSRENVYQKSRDGFYKYFNEYLNNYGVENLLEVDSVTITKAEQAPDYEFHQIVKYYNLEDDTDFNEYTREEVHTYAAYNVEASWTYVQGKTFDTSKYPVVSKFTVVFNDELNRFEIVSMNFENNTKEVSNNG